MRQKFILSLLNILTLCVVITAVSVFFINEAQWIGIVLILLALLCMISLIPFKIKLRSLQPDIIFGWKNGRLSFGRGRCFGYCQSHCMIYLIGGPPKCGKTTLAKKLSQTSPIGKALLGKKVGESVDVEAPAGKIVYEILEIK